MVRDEERESKGDMYGQIDTWSLVSVYTDVTSQFSIEFHGKLNECLKVSHNSDFRYDIGMKKNLIYMKG